MFNIRRNKMTNDLDSLNQQLFQIIDQIEDRDSDDPVTYVTSEKEELQEITSTLNELIKSYEKKHQDLAIKHEIVTRLNQIGTWDGVVYDGELKFEDYNEYNDTLRQELGYENEEDFPSVLSSWYNTVSEQDLDMVTL